jgi:hypothetical protein
MYYLRKCHLRETLEFCSMELFLQRRSCIFSYQIDHLYSIHPRLDQHYCKSTLVSARQKSLN